jgi:hypothetical protein
VPYIPSLRAFSAVKARVNPVRDPTDNAFFIGVERFGLVATHFKSVIGREEQLTAELLVFLNEPGHGFIADICKGFMLSHAAPPFKKQKTISIITAPMHT